MMNIPRKGEMDPEWNVKSPKPKVRIKAEIKMLITDYVINWTTRPNGKTGSRIRKAECGKPNTESRMRKAECGKRNWRKAKYGKLNTESRKRWVLKSTTCEFQNADLLKPQIKPQTKKTHVQARVSLICRTTDRGTCGTCGTHGTCGT